jgi:O-acetyl-ADP-ribose deacetylase (regulator of RNase III)
MSKIVYRRGNLFENLPTDKSVLIAHVCNNKGGFGKGFVVSLSSFSPRPEEFYREKYKEGRCQLGRVQFIKLNNVYVANMIAQNGYKSSFNPVPLSYPHLKECLIKVAEFAKNNNANVYAPRFGAGLAGGKWEEIEKIIEEVFLNSVEVNIFDL